MHLAWLDKLQPVILGLNEIEVSIDRNSTERPNLVSDLNFTPFVIGYPNQEIVFSILYRCPRDRQG